MTEKFTGPFFVKQDEEYSLAGMCEDCAFGDEQGCILNPCVYFQYMTETEEEK